MRSVLAGTWIFSGIINVVSLAGPLFMLEIYDRVIPSKSVPSMIALLILLIGLYVFSAAMEIIRNRMLTRMAAKVDTNLCENVFRAIATAPLRLRVETDVLKPAQEADQIRTFISGPGPAALFDLPWTPLFLAACFFVHPMIGWLVAGTMVVLIVLALISNILTRKEALVVSQTLSKRNRLGEAAHHNAEAIAAMGMLDQAARGWISANANVSRSQTKVNDIVTFFGGMTKAIRQIVQSGTLALGAWLVITGDISAGAIVASSVIAARALQPIEQIIGVWRQMLAARQSFQRLRLLFKYLDLDNAVERTSLPSPHEYLSVEGLTIAPPGEQRRFSIRNVNFRVEAGTVVGIIGPSAAGKSSLVRAIAGAWRPSKGRVSLDGAALELWATSERVRHIGYMPQNSDFFPGTIAENIARLDGAAKHSDIVDAAQTAGVHDMIVALPEGYETYVDNGGAGLSAGQRQRVALARALFGRPFLVILDEPNSNLDMDGERALATAIAAVKARSGIVLVVAHRNSVMSQVDRLLVVEAGDIRAFGPKDTVLRSLQQIASPQLKSPKSNVLNVVQSEAV